MSDEREGCIVPLSVPVLDDRPLESDAAFHRRYCENEFERGH